MSVHCFYEYCRNGELVACLVRGKAHPTRRMNIIMIENITNIDPKYERRIIWNTKLQYVVQYTVAREAWRLLERGSDL